VFDLDVALAAMWQDGHVWCLLLLEAFSRMSSALMVLVMAVHIEADSNFIGAEYSNDFSFGLIGPFIDIKSVFFNHLFWRHVSRIITNFSNFIIGKFGLKNALKWLFRHAKLGLKNFLFSKIQNCVNFLIL
jgi:hypothetical protein